MSGKARATGRIRALTLAAVVLAATTGALPHTARNATAAPLAAGSDFTISSTISSSVTSSAGPALLYPGVTRYLWFTVHNPLAAPITVTALGISNVEAPAACSTANLDLGDPTFAGAVVVPARSARTVPAPKPIALIDLPTVNQDACKNVTFRFTFTGSGWYSDTPPTPPATRKIGTATVVVTSPNLAPVGTAVTMTARVVPTDPTSASGAATLRARTPTGAIAFYLTSSAGRKSLLGRATLGADGTARLRMTTLPPGAGRVHAVYVGSTTHAASTSRPATISIIAPPARCSAGYSTTIIGRPAAPVITGTRGNDFIYAVGGSYRIRAGRGNDCIVVGDGDNVINDGSGVDVVIAGHGTNRITLVGSRNTLLVGDGDRNIITVKGTKKGKKVRRTHRNMITVGDGTANRITVRKGSRNVIDVGDGEANRVTIRRGNRNLVTVGDGAVNRLIIRKGARNQVTIGDGAANRIKVGTGTRNRVTLGDGDRNRVTMKGKKARTVLGAGTSNRVLGRKGSSRTVCSLPAPPSTWLGKPARYYRNTLARCRVVTR
jgi:hypothetical protein